MSLPDAVIARSLAESAEVYTCAASARGARMDRSGWTRLWEQFHAALELAPDARAAWLDHHVSDPDARAELDALLHAHAREHALDRPLHDPPPHAPSSGRRLGDWHLLHELGRGGMGTVWLAERERAGYVQRAAIKFVATPFAQPALAARFRREQRILARLQHPDIARLLDGGLSDDGVPWLAMEYVDGVPLQTWCRERAPTLAQRLTLMLRLCAAVHYAHQGLVVHRDIKPGNVLVRDDDAPVLLDFGIARLLQDDTDPERTGTAMPAPFTPRYASPEQLQGRAVGTASDVWSLGVVLYELLAGAAPFEPADGDWSDWVAQVSTRDPPPPSARGGVLALDRELDAIVAMALRKEPERRYASVAALGDDLQRYLAHRPIRARADSAWYRAAKFVRRHRIGVALGVAALLLLGILGVRLAIESERANAALAVSQRERDRAEQSLGFVSELFREVDPTRGEGGALSSREVLERGVALLETRRLEPGARAAMLTALGEIFVNVGAYERAASLFDQALALLPAQGADGLRADALHGQGGALQAAARHAEARRVLLDALPLRRAVYGDASLEAAATLERLGGAEQALSHLDAARAAYAEVLALRRAQLGPDDTRIADVQLRLGSLAWSTGAYDEAEVQYRDALQLRRRHPQQAAELARALDAVGALAHVRGRHAEAEQHYLEALQLRRAVLGEQHRLTADSLGNLGALAYDRGDPAGAVPLLQQALQAQQAAVGADNPVVAKTLNNLALAEAALGRRDAARAGLERALAINRAAFGESHPRVAGNLNNLGLVRLDDGDAAGAERDFVQALVMQRALGGESDPQLGFALTNHARALAELGRADAAEASFARALALRRAHLHDAHPSLAETLVWYGTLRCEHGDGSGGAAMLEEAYALRQRVFGASHPSSAAAASLLGACLSAQGRDARALREAALRTASDPGSGAGLRRRSAWARSDAP
jgi:tetratricopeptide (TPR) repeat protein